MYTSFQVALIVAIAAVLILAQSIGYERLVARQRRQLSGHRKVEKIMATENLELATVVSRLERRVLGRYEDEDVPLFTDDELPFNVVQLPTAR